MARAARSGSGSNAAPRPPQHASPRRESAASSSSGAASASAAAAQRPATARFRLDLATASTTASAAPAAGEDAAGAAEASARSSEAQTDANSDGAEAAEDKQRQQAGGAGKAAAGVDDGVQTSPGDAVELIKAWRTESLEAALAAAAATTPSRPPVGAPAMADAACGPSDGAAGEQEAAAAMGAAEEGVGSVGASPYQTLAFKEQHQQDEERRQDAAAAADPAPAPAPRALAAAAPRLLARFKVNTRDSVAVFMATTAEDYDDVAGLRPADGALPAGDTMCYLLARLEAPRASVTGGGSSGSGGSGSAPLAAPGALAAALARVAAGAAAARDAVGPAVGCLMATMGTSLISDCIFDFEDPPELAAAGGAAGAERRLELWGLQIPHALPAGARGGGGGASGAGDGGEQQQQRAADGEAAAEAQQQQQQFDMRWSSADRLNVSVGLLYALCAAARAAGATAGLCAPRPQLLRRWLQAGVAMRQVGGPPKLIYPPAAHDYAYYKGSTVAYFLVDEVRASLEAVLSVVEAGEE